MPATATSPEGRISIKGKVHGALNTLVEVFNDPEGWEFKQFVSMEQMEAYAAENNFVIVEEN